MTEWEEAFNIAETFQHATEGRYSKQAILARQFLLAVRKINELERPMLDAATGRTLNLDDLLRRIERLEAASHIHAG